MWTIENQGLNIARVAQTPASLCCIIFCRELANIDTMLKVSHNFNSLKILNINVMLILYDVATSKTTDIDVMPGFQLELQPVKNNYHRCHHE